MAQRPAAKNIVQKALYAHTRGQSLKTYVMRLEYDTLDRITSKVHQQNPFLMIVDSIMALQTDSMREAIRQQMITGEAEFWRSSHEMHLGERKVMSSDQNRLQGVLLTIRPNPLSGALDSTRNLYSGDEAIPFRQNPVDIIRFMQKEGTELHYTGAAGVNGQACHLVQFKVGRNGWKLILISKVTC